MSIQLSQNSTKIDGETKLRLVTGNQKSGHLLVADSAGRADWAPVRGQYTGNRYVGELYGGGMVVGTWNAGDDESVLIVSLQDVQDTYYPGGVETRSYAVRWSTQTSTLKGATSLYDGSTNNRLARVGITEINFVQGAAAIDFDGYLGGINGYSDWYLPSAYEMVQVYDAAFHINRVLGDGSLQKPGFTASYWTSTETDASSSVAIDMNTGRFVNTTKSASCRMRPVRLETARRSKELVTELDASNPRSYDDVKRPGRWVDTVNYGASSSYSFNFAAVSGNGPTYSADLGGYVSFDGNSYVNVESPIGDANVVSVEMWCRIKPGSNNFILFGWRAYDVWFNGSGALGFNTGAGDLYGFSNSKVGQLGLVGNWKHYVFVMRSDVSYSNNKIYVNGVLEAPDQVWLFDENPANRNFNGGLGRVAGFRASNEYLGNLDVSVVRIFKREMTASEVAASFARGMRRFEIGIPATHSIDVSPGTGTFSVSQNLVLDVRGKRSGKVLRSDKNGVTSWSDKNYLFDRPAGERFVGERFYGGIIASKWRYPSSVINYLIMSDSDQNVVAATVYQGGSAQSYFEIFALDLRDYVSAGMSVGYVVGGVSKTLSVSSVTIRTGAFSTYWTRVFVNETLASTAQSFNTYVTLGSSGLAVRWSSITSASVPSAGGSAALSDFKGASNSYAITQQAGVTNSVATLATKYQSLGFGGWYVPALSELTEALTNLASVGYNYGTSSVPDGRYWTSTESSSTPTTRAVEVTVRSQGTMFGVTASLKTTGNKVRPFRQVRVVQERKNWAKPNPWDDPAPDWNTDPWDERNWQEWGGLVTDSLVFHFNPDRYDSLPREGGALAAGAVDVSGGRVGSVRPLVTWDSSFNSVRFNGTYSTSTFTQNSYISFGSPIRTDLYTYTTIEAWIYPDLPVEVGVNDDERCGVVSTAGYELTFTQLQNLSQYPAGIALYMGSNDGTDTYKIKLGFDDNSGSGFLSILDWTTAERPIRRYEWSHVVAVWGGGGGQYDSLYVNGELVASVASGLIFSGGSDGATNGLDTTYKRTLVGCSSYGVKKVFAGLINQVRVYSTVLTAAQVKRNFESERARFGI